MPLPATLWTNPLQTTPASLQQKLELLPLRWYPGAFRCPPGFTPSATLPYLAGHYQIQEEAAMASVALMAPQPGETILDLCAAPGNKTSQIAVHMQSQGLVVANDRSRQRLGILRRSINHLGLTNVAITVYDATSYPGEPESYDRILADVPCSGEGTARRFKKTTPFISEKRRAHLGNIQSAILERAIMLCKTGGLIVYATCTFAPEENEAIVSAALHRHQGALALEPARLDGLKTAPGITTWEGDVFHPEMHHTMRIWPHHNDTGGFFTALIRKTGTTRPPASATPARLDTLPTASPVQEFEDRFGIPAATFDGYMLQQYGKFLSIRSFAHIPAGIPAPVQAGLPFCRPAHKSQKLKTGAAIRWGHKATRNLVALTAAQAHSYGKRETFDIEMNQLDAHTTPGYVLLRHQDMYLGLGFLRNTSTGLKIESLLPKHWIHTLQP